MSLPTCLPLPRIRFERGFLAERARLVREVVIPYQWEALNDRVPGAERSGTINNFKVAAGERPGEFYGYWFQDSDLAKWLEAASFSLATHPDPKLDAELDGIIATIAKAQQPDGYLDTFVQLTAPDKRWTNLFEWHELYIAGHFIEAGVAHFEATGKRTLLDVVGKLADMIEKVFGLGAGQIPGYPGHEEIELALVKLARVTGEKRYVQLAAYFINQRGAAPNYFDAESQRLGVSAKLPIYFYKNRWEYLQAEKPVRDALEPVGHAVRAMYLYTAMADLARELGDQSLRQACHTLWNNLRDYHTYITGAVGSEWEGEQFSGRYDLPNDRAYAESCAGIGLVFFARRMLDLELRGEFADAMERTLFNNVLAGMALDGKTFFYVNPLEVRPEEAKARRDQHYVKTQRVPWFGCACCPPNIARTLTSLGYYVHSVQPDGLAIHLYADCALDATVAGVKVGLAVKTDYPWDGKVRVEVTPRGPAKFGLRLRLPGWCTAPSASVNGAPVDLAAHARDGYLHLDREWAPGDVVTLDLPMTVQRVRAHPRVHYDLGCVALQRGPLVFCVEQIDNGPQLAQLVLPKRAVLTARFDAGLLGGAIVIEGAAERITPASNELYSTAEPIRVPATLRAVPYCLWNNRGEGEMRVWLRED
ncbi:glycoside hydrolase family 127 protein [Horticoccus luteus]|uniref:Glycoside hydrolase family 127 protein n=1 Tax=Horticoccus luteus TaxID=2862869 RepID=A0A8F9TWG0_9BACT|nr:beta-L-arabinofuranosidase domain-containing protein [Horticoccus luteus]QYM79266.1 glycoside hydrolase family 127 protein [Horticoccus luteus]